MSNISFEVLMEGDAIRDRALRKIRGFIDATAR
jgi:hypothetical protein